MADNKKFSTRDAIAAAASAAKSGDVQRAYDLYSAVLARFPNHGTAKKGLSRLQKASGGGSGVSQDEVNVVVGLIQSGEMVRAEKQTRDLILRAPNESVLHNILGLAISHTGTPKDAAKCYQRAVALRPNYVEALNNLGLMLLKLGKTDDAIAQLRKAAATNPAFAEAHHNLGTAYKQIGKLDDALAAFSTALSIQPNYVNAMNSKAALFRDLDRLDEAETLFKLARDSDPSDVDVMINLGNIYSDQGRFELAIETMEIALTLPNTTAEPHHRIGTMLGILGKTEEAIARLEAAISIDPTLFEAYHSLSTLRKFSSTDPLIAKMEQMIQRPDANSTGRLHLGFALGKALEDAQDYKKAFKYLKIGNAEKRKLLQYSSAETRSTFSTLKTVSGRAFASKFEDVANPSNKPLLILGMNRSGTSLIEQILASHTQVFGGGELTMLGKIAHRPFSELATWTAEDISETAANYLALLDDISDNEPIVTDKMPANFRLIGVVKAIFPNAKIVNMTRDPLDVCLSNFKNHFAGPSSPYAYELMELGEYYAMYADLMDHWRAMFEDQIYDCSYELMIADPEAETRKLLEHCNLDWEPQLLDFHTTKRVVKTASVFQVRQKLYSSSVRSWQKYEQELEPLIAVLRKAGRLPDYSATSA